MISNNILVVDQDGNISNSSMLTLDLRNYNFVKEIKNFSSTNGSTIDQNYYQINTNKIYMLVCNVITGLNINFYNGFVIVDNKDNYAYNNSNQQNVNVYFKYNPVYSNGYTQSPVYVGQLFVQYQTDNPGYIIPCGVTHSSTGGSMNVYGTVSVYESI